ncbi:GNAT family N-acetyltransferase [Azospirillum rugosum]|uniref:RimJ/RimL family protein N-acetyltransferase n=1 Tax=Azospirillum rugosum TaxID=416170 RepID=A0ABS4SRY1_9PROT|nr:GNAT family N-acetyltransferase [Azospirillum rugosum]MBP2295323.1 RimJ/RimL family protein N-acetyltransferase [Azospirillum rugosum]MDQ0528698.1 RimJ/RimL family protein N-acetyltransferase [Azospirillum rugosum]
MPVFRKLLPAELAQYRAHLLRLDRADRYARFTGTVSDETIAKHCAKLDWGRTILLGVFDQGELRGAVELCTDRLLWPHEAELAISVEKGLQGRRVGTTLVRRALAVAANRGIRRVHMMCLSDNVRMRALSRKFGGRMSLQDGEIAVAFDLPHPTQFSLALEALEDGAGAVNAMLDTLPAILKAAA